MRTTPRTSPRLASIDQSAVEDLEAKLKVLEERFLGSVISSKVDTHSPYTAISSVRKMIDLFKESLTSSSRECVQSKLPNVPLPHLMDRI